VPIPGADGPEYTPGPADDRTHVTCRVGAGGGLRETPPLRVTRAPPRVVAPLWDEVLDAWGGTETLPVAQAFAGEDLAFTAMGARARIDPATGLLELPTDLPLSGEPVRIVAENSGGAAALEFRVTVEGEAPGATLAAQALFVDHGAGSDANPGTDERAPRKTVPARPGPGTVIYLRRGAVYRDPVSLATGGRPGAPVVLDGQSWGPPSAPKARIDLSAPLTGWMPGPVLDGARTWRAPVPPAILADDGVFGYLMLFQGERRLFWAQSPAPSDPAYPSEARTEFHTFEGLREAGERILVKAPQVFERLSPSPEGYFLRIWVEGNSIQIRPVLAYDPRTGEAAIPRGRGRANPSMRLPRFAVFSHPAALRAPGRFYFDPRTNEIVVRPHDDGPAPEAGIRHAAGGSGIRFTAPHTEIRGLEIRRCMDRRPRSGGIIGLIDAGGSDTGGIVIADCDVRESCLGGSGIVLTHAATAGRVRDARIERNTATDLPTGGCRGIWASRLEGGILRENRAERNSSTSISLYTCSGTRVYGNVAGDPSGIHGNGFSFYEGCREIVVMFNTVFLPGAAGMAMTAQSAGRCVFACNTLVMRDRNAAAHYGPKERYPEEGGHIWANNVIQTVEENLAFRMDTRSPGGNRGVSPILGTVLVNNICHGITPTETAGRGSFAARTRNVLTARRQNQLTPAQMAAIGEIFLPDRDALFRDWRAGDFRPTRAAWTAHLSRGARVTIRGVTLDWIGRFRADGSDAWDWRREPL
jgi:parallel beta-helix repeat protein